MKKVITVLMFLGILYISGCSRINEKIDGVVFSQTKGGETKYAKGETVYMFEAGNEISDTLFNQLKSKIDFQEKENTENTEGAEGAEFIKLSRVFNSLRLCITSMSVDSLKNINTIKIYQTTTDDKGNFTFQDIPFGDYYIFVSNLWDIVYYDNESGVQNITTGEIKYKKITIDKKTEKIIL